MILIREAFYEDLNKIYEISKDSFSNSWSLEGYKEDFKNMFSKYFVIEIDDLIVGFLSSWIVMNEITITNLTIEKNFRNKGLSKELLGNFLNNYKNHQIFLEVRKSNEIAINLYKKFLFKELSIRKNYYKNPVEDAIVMKKF